MEASESKYTGWHRLSRSHTWHRLVEAESEAECLERRPEGNAYREVSGRRAQHLGVPCLSSCTAGPAARAVVGGAGSEGVGRMRQRTGNSVPDGYWERSA